MYWCRLKVQIDDRDNDFFFKTNLCFSAINKLALFCSVENSEYLSALLKEWGIPHNVLNARPKVDLKLTPLHSETNISFKLYKLSSNTLCFTSFSMLLGKLILQPKQEENMPSPFLQIWLAGALILFQEEIQRYFG